MSECSEECSEECCDLFHRLFEHDVSERIDIDGVLDHNFIRNHDCSLTIRPISSERGTPSSVSGNGTSNGNGNGNGNVPPSLSPVNVPMNNPCPSSPSLKHSLLSDIFNC